MYQNVVMQAWEGVVCKVVRPPLERQSFGAFGDGTMWGRWYAWLVGNLSYFDDIIEFKKNGAALTSRGPGTWQQDSTHPLAIWLDWPSEKPVMLGGREGAVPTAQRWLLQFNDDR